MKVGDLSNNNQNIYLNNAQNAQAKALNNVAASRALDGTDSANLVIADSLRSDANATAQGVRNANDAIGYLQIADGTLSNINQSADRMNVLSIQANSAIQSPESLRAIRSEAESLKTSMQDSISQATFNGQNVFGGMANFQTGNGEVSVSVQAPNVQSLSVDNQQSIADFQRSVNSSRTTIGSTQNGLMSGINVALGYETNARASESQLQNNDAVQNTEQIKQNNILINSATLAMSHNTSLLASKIGSLLS